jgi:hypothetical protein
VVIGDLNGDKAEASSSVKARRQLHQKLMSPSAPK